MDQPLEVSVVIPTRRGGPLLEAVVEAVLAQQCARSRELVLVDSGSSAEELRRLRGLGARIEPIPPESFDHGLARDRGAAAARGAILVFINQDALPAAPTWLEELIRPLTSPDPPAAVQGGIAELPAGELERLGLRRFYWDSGGPRFYFTSESVDWIARYGCGFSTVNCALVRTAWEAIPFGPAGILEDKKWQRAAVARGLRIVAAPRALVWHTHDYDLRALVRRCVSEGLGWRQVGERYTLGACARDLARRELWREWRRGIAGVGLRPAEALFPLLRPVALWWGNRWAARLRL